MNEIKCLLSFQYAETSSFCLPSLCFLFLKLSLEVCRSPFITLLWVSSMFILRLLYSLEGFFRCRLSTAFFRPNAKGVSSLACALPGILAVPTLEDPEFIMSRRRFAPRERMVVLRDKLSLWAGNITVGVKRICERFPVKRDSSGFLPALPSASLFTVVRLRWLMMFPRRLLYSGVVTRFNTSWSKPPPWLVFFESSPIIRERTRLEVSFSP